MPTKGGRDYPATSPECGRSLPLAALSPTHRVMRGGSLSTASAFNPQRTETDDPYPAPRSVLLPSLTPPAPKSARLRSLAPWEQLRPRPAWSRSPGYINMLAGWPGPAIPLLSPLLPGVFPELSRSACLQRPDPCKWKRGVGGGGGGKLLFRECANRVGEGSGEERRRAAPSADSRSCSRFPSPPHYFT